MKNLSTILLLILWNISFSQNYLDTNPEWTEYTISCGGGNPYCTSQEYTITLEADTLIDNVSYFKTKRNGTTTTWDWTVDTLVSENPIDDYLYPLREEQGKFYIYHTFQNEEQLLHDFNLSLGDTAISSSFCQNPQIVMEIDTIFFGTQMRKKFIFEPQLTFGNSPLYEGIGTSRGLLVRPCSGTIGIESGSILQCYTADSETIQIDTAGQCETTIPVSTKDVKSNEFEIYPNPFDKRILIENKWRNSSEIIAKVFDFQGRLILMKLLSKSESQTEISTDEINSGNYILVIYSDNKVYATKMIKIEK